MNHSLLWSAISFTLRCVSHSTFPMQKCPKNFNLTKWQYLYVLPWHLNSKKMFFFRNFFVFRFSIPFIEDSLSFTHVRRNRVAIWPFWNRLPEIQLFGNSYILEKIVSFMEYVAKIWSESKTFNEICLTDIDNFSLKICSSSYLIIWPFRNCSWSDLAFFIL